MPLDSAFARLCRLGPALALVAIVLGPAPWAHSADDKPQPASAAQLKQLIEQLGAESYDLRVRAQNDLAKLGLDAFDALLAAQTHPTIEIQMRAKYLLRSIAVHWTEENDPAAVQTRMKDYHLLRDEDRKARIDGLASLDEPAVLAVLCRVARYEQSPVLSKWAALKAIQRKTVLDEANRKALATAIDRIAGPSERPAVLWLRTLAQTWADPSGSLPRWAEHSQFEEDTLAQQPRQTSREIVRDLYRWQIELLTQLKRDQDAVAMMRRTYEFLDGSTAQLTEIVDWLVSRQAWSGVLELRDRYPAVFADSHTLLYRLAEAQLALKQDPQSAASAKQARELRSDNFAEHLVAAKSLTDRGLLEFAEQEYRMVIEAAGAGGPAFNQVMEFQARFELAEMLHDFSRDLPAGEVLKPAVEKMFPPGKDPAEGESARENAQRARRAPDGIRARMHYFYALHYREQKDLAKAKAELKSALDGDGADADVLIAYFRLPNLDDAEQTDIRARVQESIDEYRDGMKNGEEALKEADSEAEKQQALNYIALECNQFAWLVSNTFGDFEAAAKASHRSLDIKPEEGGYWDTLGRCYYAKGDLEGAIKHQQHAVKLQPHSGQIRKQLEFFQAELARKAVPAKQP